MGQNNTLQVQAPLWDIQNNRKSSMIGWSHFVLDFPARYFPSSKLVLFLTALSNQTSQWPWPVLETRLLNQESGQCTSHKIPLRLSDTVQNKLHNTQFNSWSLYYSNSCCLYINFVTFIKTDWHFWGDGCTKWDLCSWGSPPIFLRFVILWTIILYKVGKVGSCDRVAKLNFPFCKSKFKITVRRRVFHDSLTTKNGQSRK